MIDQWYWEKERVRELGMWNNITQTNKQSTMKTYKKKNKNNIYSEDL